MARYRATRDCFHEGVLFQKGDVFDWDGEARPDWEGLDQGGKKKVTEAQERDRKLKEEKQKKEEEKQKTQDAVKSALQGEKALK
jgi:hypothetical protein